MKEKLEELRKIYYDARHHCYAYILEPDYSKIRANDDGEPNHSAGDPILGQIRSKNVTNCLVVVVRYFGGTKLGVGGLVNAYKTAAANALEKAEITEHFLMSSFSVKYTYDATNEVMRIAKSLDLAFGDQLYGETCQVVFSIRQGKLRQAVEAFSHLKDIWVNP